MALRLMGRILRSEGRKTLLQALSLARRGRERRMPRTQTARNYQPGVRSLAPAEHDAHGLADDDGGRVDLIDGAVRPGDQIALSTPQSRRQRGLLGP